MGAYETTRLKEEKEEEKQKRQKEEGEKTFPCACPCLAKNDRDAQLSVVKYRWQYT